MTGDDKPLSFANAVTQVIDVDFQGFLNGAPRLGSLFAPWKAHSTSSSLTMRRYYLTIVVRFEDVRDAAVEAIDVA
ncbi:MAG TPA: hypothetical protein VH253_12935 [Phycisphaerae bacterium]|nr:hypothetical protein [Phycisphaerae bacterium]